MRLTPSFGVGVFRFSTPPHTGLSEFRSLLPPFYPLGAGALIALKILALLLNFTSKKKLWSKRNSCVNIFWGFVQVAQKRLYRAAAKARVMAILKLPVRIFFETSQNVCLLKLRFTSQLNVEKQFWSFLPPSHFPLTSRIIFTSFWKKKMRLNVLVAMFAWSPRCWSIVKV